MLDKLATDLRFWLTFIKEHASLNIPEERKKTVYDSYPVVLIEWRNMLAIAVWKCEGTERWQRNILTGHTTKKERITVYYHQMHHEHLDWTGMRSSCKGYDKVQSFLLSDPDYNLGTPEYLPEKGTMIFIENRSYEIYVKYTCTKLQDFDRHTCSWNPIEGIYKINNRSLSHWSKKRRLRAS